MKEQNYIRAIVIARAAEIGISAYAIAKASGGGVSQDTVRAYLAGRHDLTSGRLQFVLRALGLGLSPKSATKHLEELTPPPSP